MNLTRKRSNPLKTIIILSLSLVSGCGGGGTNNTSNRPIDNTKPFIVSTFPRSKATVDTNTVIRITFSESINAVQSDNVSIKPINSDGSIGLPIVIDKKILQLSNQATVLSVELASTTPSLTLAPSTKYLVEVSRIKDYTGNEMSGTCRWLFATTGAVIPESMATTKLCNDPLPMQGLFEFTTSQTTVNEADNEVQIQIKRIGGVDGRIELNLETISSGQASADLDYESKPQTIIFADGQREQIARVAIINDTISKEPLESFTVRLSLSVANQAILGMNVVHRINIIDNDILALNFTTKKLNFSWSHDPDIVFYKLMANNNASGYLQLGKNLTDLKTSIDISVHQYDWLNSRYLIEACKSDNDCFQSNEIFTLDQDEKAIGYIKASNTGEGDTFGYAIAISDDGDTLVISAKKESGNYVGVITSATLPLPSQRDNAAPESGAVYVYRRQLAGQWQQQAYIKASNTDNNDHFGSSVTISGDGKTLAVGAYWEDSATTGVINSATLPVHTLTDNSALNSGAVYIFTLDNNNTWLQQAYIKANNTEPEQQFGHAIALSQNGNTLAVGSNNESSNRTGIISDPTRFPNTAATNRVPNSGAVYVYKRSTSNNWSQHAYIKADRSGAFQFGASLALSDNGTTLAVGANLENSSLNQVLNGTPVGTPDVTAIPLAAAGAVYIFNQNTTGWTQQAYLKASNSGQNDQFGFSLSLSAAGDTLAVGAFLEDSGHSGVINSDVYPVPARLDNAASDSGATYIFVRNASGNWLQQAYLKANNGDALDQFGYSVSLSHNGDTLAVGSYQESSSITGVIQSTQSGLDNNSINAGAAYLYRRVANNWSLQSYIKGKNTTSNNNFGSAVALSQFAQTLIISACNEDKSNQEIDRLDFPAIDSGAVYLY